MFSNLLPVSIGITDPQSISWEAAVALPERTKIDDWISYNLQDFFFEVISFFSVIQFYCTNEHCPIMKGHDEYKWKDRDTKSKISLPAPKYIALAFEWLHMEFESENHFPSISINKYSEIFQTVIAPQVAKELARIYSHIVCFHNEHFSKDSPDKGRLGISLHHFYHFVKLYNLISKSTWGQLQNSLEISGEANSLVNIFFFFALYFRF